MLMKLTPGIHFINVLQTAFTCTNPKSVKRQSSCQSFFTLSGTMTAKAAHKALVKLTPVLSFEYQFKFSLNKEVT